MNSSSVNSKIPLKNDYDVSTKKTEKPTSLGLPVDNNIMPQKKSYDVALSDKAQTRVAEKKKAFDVAKNSTEINEAKIAEIKKKIASGEYNIEAQEIAKGILKEAIKERLSQESEDLELNEV